MNTLWAASIRHLLRHPAQLGLALLGLALGVATIIAVDIATASSGRAFELSMEAVNGAATHEIQGGPGGIDEQLYVRLKTEGVAASLAPVVEGYVDVGDETMQLVGIDPLVDAEVRGGVAVVGWRRGEPALGGAASAAAPLMSPPPLPTASTPSPAGSPNPVQPSWPPARPRRIGISVGQPFSLDIGGTPHDAKADQHHSAEPRPATKRCCSRTSPRPRNGSGCKAGCRASTCAFHQALKANAPSAQLESHPAHKAFHFTRSAPHQTKPRHDGRLHHQPSGNEPAGFAGGHFPDLQRSELRGRPASPSHGVLRRSVPPGPAC